MDELKNACCFLVPLKGLGASSFQSLPGTCLGRMLESLIPEGPPLQNAG